MAENKLLVSDDDFQRWLQREIRFMEKLVRETKPTEIAPRLLVVGSEGEGQPLAVRVVTFANGLDEDKKHETFAALGVQFYSVEKFAPLAAFLTSECWISRQRRGSPQLMPSRDPAKTEAVTIAARTIDGRDVMALSAIRRDKHGTIRLDKFETNFAQTQSLILQAFFDGFARAALNGLLGR